MTTKPPDILILMTVKPALAADKAKQDAAKKEPAVKVAASFDC